MGAGAGATPTQTGDTAQELTPGIITDGRMSGLLQVKPVPNRAQLLVKLPEVLRDEIKAAAKKEGLSTNQWVLNLLIAAVRPQDKE